MDGQDLKAWWHGCRWHGWVGFVIILLLVATVSASAQDGQFQAVYDLNWQLRYYLKNNVLYSTDWQVQYYIRDDSVFDKRWIKRYYIKDDALYDWDWHRQYYIREFKTPEKSSP